MKFYPNINSPVKPSRRYFIVAVVLFVVVFVVGFVHAIQHPETPLQSYLDVANTLKNSNIDGLNIIKLINNKPATFLVILLANTFADLLGMLGGLLLAIPTLLSFLADKAWGSILANGFNQHFAAYSLWGFLPHAILEAVANLTADALGLWLGVRSLKALFRKEHGQLKPAISYSLKVFILFVVPLLIVCAAIEAFVSPVLAKHFGASEVQASITRNHNDPALIKYKQEHPQQAQQLKDYLKENHITENNI